MVIDQFEKWLNHQIEHSFAAGEAAPKMDIMYARGRRAALDAAKRELAALVAHHGL